DKLRQRGVEHRFRIQIHRARIHDIGAIDAPHAGPRIAKSDEHDLLHVPLYAGGKVAKWQSTESMPATRPHGACRTALYRRFSRIRLPLSPLPPSVKLARPRPLQGAMSPAAPHPEVLVEYDQACIGCGYALRGLPVAGVCPECGMAIARSFRGDRLAAA